MRHFEYCDKKSDKFWEIQVVDNDVVVVFGRNGTDGQSKVKTFDNPEEAEAHAEKLIKEKTKKGYVEC